MFKVIWLIVWNCHEQCQFTRRTFFSECMCEVQSFWKPKIQTDNLVCSTSPEQKISVWINMGFEIRIYRQKHCIQRKFPESLNIRPQTTSKILLGHFHFLSGFPVGQMVFGNTEIIYTPMCMMCVMFIDNLIAKLFVNHVSI
jgi:hypothetical protein